MGQVYHSTAEVAAVLCVTPQTVRNLCRRGEIPHAVVGGRYVVTAETYERIVRGLPLRAA